MALSGMSGIVNMYSITATQLGQQLADNASLFAAGEAPFDALDLRSFSTFISRSVHLEALIMHHTGAPALSWCVRACVCAFLCRPNIVYSLCAALPGRFHAECEIEQSLR